MNDEAYSSIKCGQHFIVELSSQTINVIAQAIHIYLVDNPNSDAAAQALRELREQTDKVFKDPKDHFVYSSILNAPPYTKTINPIVYRPVV